MATDSVQQLPTELKAWLAGFQMRVDESLFQGPTIDPQQLSEYELLGYMDAIVGEAVALTSIWVEEQAARQREVDAAQDSAAASGWPTVALW